MPLEIDFDCKNCKNTQTMTISNPKTEQLCCSHCGASLCRVRNIPGYLYILSNTHMPGLLKIGLTSRSVAERVAELNSATGVPSAFTVEAYFESSDPNTDETAIHKLLETDRAPNREFFRINLAEALAASRSVTGRDPLGPRQSSRSWRCPACSKLFSSTNGWCCGRPAVLIR